MFTLDWDGELKKDSAPDMTKKFHGYRQKLPLRTVIFNVTFLRRTTVRDFVVQFLSLGSRHPGLTKIKDLPSSAASDQLIKQCSQDNEKKT